jgi:hypothetical protein
MKELETIYEQILEQFEIVKTRHEKFIENKNKSAEADARVALGEIKKLITPYRKQSVVVTKSLKK